MRLPDSTAFLRGWPLLGLAALLVASAVALLLGPELTQAQNGAPTVTGVAVSSVAGDDDTYLLGETIRITLTFSEAVNVTGTPRLKIDMDPADWGEKWASYHSGSGTAGLTFTHTVVEPNLSTQGIAVLENTLELNGGTIQSASSQTDAALFHTGLAHNPRHKVDWRRSPPAPTPTPAPEPTPTPTPPPAPAFTEVEITSNAGDDDTYLLGETIRITVTFSETVDVTGAPRLKIDMDPAEWGEKWAGYESGNGTASLTFAHTVVEPNLSTQGIAVLADTLELNGGSIKSASSQTDADLSHTGLAHDANHKVNWRRSPGQPNQAPVVDTQAENYEWFTSRQNIPRGLLFSKSFYQVFTDRDGDELTYSVSASEDHRQLLDDLSIGLDYRTPENSHQPMELFHRVWFEVDGEDDWKGISPALSDPVSVTATLTATDPEGLSVSLDSGILIDWESHPEVVRVVGSEQAIALTFDVAVEDDPAPTPGQFTVNVVNGDGTTGTVVVNGVSVNGAVLTLGLASELAEGQAATLDYAHDDDAPLQRDGGGGDHAPGFDGLAVTPPGPVSNLAVSAEPGDPDLSATWDAVDGATSYQLRWRQSDGEFEADNATTVSDTTATITVTANGQWEVRVQGCNDAGCGPEASATATVALAPLDPPENFAVSVQRGELDLSARWDAEEGATSYKLRWRKAGGEFTAANAITVSDTNATITVSGYGQWEVWLQACNDAGCVPEAGGSAGEAPVVRLNLEPAQDGQGQVQVRTFTATRNPVADAASYTLGWRQAGANSQAQAQSQPDYARQPRAAAGPSGAVGPSSADQTDTTPPRLERGEIDGDTMTFYFSEALDENATGARFRVTLYFRNGWCNFTAHPSRVEVSDNKVVVFGLSRGGWPGWERAPVGWGVQAYYYIDDRVVPAGERLRDLAGNEVSTPHRSLGGHFPATRTIDLVNLTQPPLLQGAAAHPRWLTLTFDETLDRNSAPAASAFTVTVNGSAVSLADTAPVVVSGNAVTLVLAAAVSATDVVTVSYAKPSGSPLRGPDGEAENFTGRSVTNRVGAVPSVSEVEIASTPADGDAYAPDETIQVQVTFTEAVTVDPTGGTPRLKIRMAPNYGGVWADYASGSGTAELTFDYTVVEPDRSTRGVAVLRDTLDLNGGTIRSVATPQQDAHRWFPGLDYDPDHMVDWRRSAPGVPWVTGVEITSDPGSDGAYANGDTVQVTATFSEAVNVVTTGGTPRLKIKLAPGIYRSADDEERWAAYASGSGTAELTFDYTVAAADRSTWGVAVVRNTLELNGGTVRSTTATPVNAHLRNERLDHDPNHRVNGTTLTLQSATLDGTRLVLTYDDALDENSAPAATAFTVKVNGSAVSLADADPVAVRSVAVLLTLAEAVAENATVTVSYAKPTGAAASKLRDQAGNEAASFTDQAVSPDTTPPRLLGGEFDGDTITLYFSEALDPDSVGGYFRVNLQLIDNMGNPRPYDKCRFTRSGWETFTTTPREVYVSGNTAVVVGLKDNPRYRAGVGQHINNFSYRVDDTTRRLRDLAGNPVSTPKYNKWNNYWRTKIFTWPSVTRMPWPERATVVGKQLILTFSAHMDGGSVPEASAFTVKVGGSQVNLANANPVSVSGNTVTLTLATAVAAGDTVTVSYAKPSGSPLQNVICEDAESITDQAVTNFTGVSAVSDVAISSDPGDDTYGSGETIRVQLTFTEAVTVTGKPRLKIGLNPGSGEKLLWYESGSGTSNLVFARKVLKPHHRVEPEVSTAGIAVLANSLELNGGAIRYVSSGKPAYLAHAGLGHNTNHKVDWRR